MNSHQTEQQNLIKAFEKLRADYQLESAQIATKQDIAARQKDKEIVEQASTYTPDSLFQSLAQLQSTFGQSVDGLTKNMTTEVEKLAQIQQSIQVENQRLSTLHNIQIAAEALNILQQEHQKALQSLEEDDLQKQEALEKEISKQREVWQKQQQDNENAKNKQEKGLEKNRHSKEEEYDYKLKWQHTEYGDEYEKANRSLDRRLEEEKQRKEKDWTERENHLDKHQTEFEEYKVKIDAMPKEIEEAVKKARENAIKDTSQDEKNQATLLEKEREAKHKAFELKIESLNQTVEEQKARIANLTDKFQTASQQIQQLAATAVSSTGQSA
ncbi:hypothetical protein PN36_19885 [Candidatus Thiomargarita nelsonii]|uniref:Uncharacterized protein n=1 Tax=Candidatus Thiomargarita nelsonii TaxID=1003181 RepID=A0A0A6P1T4_9GAMM|nr:hypothetical protein PN36_19885 [Candidatus Thiomargarita nelsonii]